MLKLAKEVRDFVGILDAMSMVQAAYLWWPGLSMLCGTVTFVEARSQWLIGRNGS
jgi:hypothetical protein